MYTQICILSSAITKEQVENIGQKIFTSINEKHVNKEPQIFFTPFVSPATLDKHYYFIDLKELAEDVKMDKESVKYFIFYQFNILEEKNKKEILNSINSIIKNHTHVHRTHLFGDLHPELVELLIKTRSYSKPHFEN